MNVAIIGFGKMGQGLASLLKKDTKITFIVDPNPIDKKKTNKVPAFKKINDVPDELIRSVDIFMEFTEPKKAKENILAIIKKKKNAKIICGTTSWDPEKIYKDIKSHDALLLHSANFSVGINALSRLVNELTGKILDTHNFDVSIVEHHHEHKKDSPSGTASMLAKIMDENGFDCSITSIRHGDNPGTHIISFDSEFETLEIKHEVSDRRVFCSGVIMAAKWLVKQKKPGIYSFSDVK
ncbi:MAG: dihydrodipicolinate reductase C-terminal domain-containing protein [bacterium]